MTVHVIMTQLENAPIVEEVQMTSFEVAKERVEELEEEHPGRRFWLESAPLKKGNIDVDTAYALLDGG